MFEHFSLPDVTLVSRRTVLGALVLGVAGLAVCLFFNQIWAGLGLCLGLAAGLLNFRLIQRSVLKAGRRAEDHRRRPLALNTLSRMLLLTAAALVLLIVEPPLGFGLLGGLALFQVLLLLNVTRSMLKMGTLPADGPTGSAGLEVSDEPARER